MPGGSVLSAGSHTVLTAWNGIPETEAAIETAAVSMSQANAMVSLWILFLSPGLSTGWSVVRVGPE